MDCTARRAKVLSSARRALRLAVLRFHWEWSHWKQQQIKFQFRHMGFDSMILLQIKKLKRVFVYWAVSMKKHCIISNIQEHAKRHTLFWIIARKGGKKQHCNWSPLTYYYPVIVSWSIWIYFAF